MLGIFTHDTLKKTRSESNRAERNNDLPPSSRKDADRYQRSLNELRHEQKFSGNRILVQAGDCDFERLAPHFESVTVAAGKELYAACEINQYVYFPETAVISHLCILADGNSLEIAMIGNEGATGLGAVIGSQPPMHQAVVAIEGRVWRIRTELLRQEFQRGGKFQTLLIDYVNAYLVEVSQRVVCESFHPIKKRLCCWLLMLDDRVRKNQLLLTHEQMSQFLGVNRPTLTVVAKNLRDEKLINYVRGKFYILDRQKLEETACECYAAVRAGF